MENGKLFRTTLTLMKMRTNRKQIFACTIVTEHVLKRARYTQVLLNCKKNFKAQVHTLSNYLDTNAHTNGRIDTADCSFLAKNIKQQCSPFVTNINLKNCHSLVVSLSGFFILILFVLQYSSCKKKTPNKTTSGYSSWQYATAKQDTTFIMVKWVMYHCHHHLTLYHH